MSVPRLVCLVGVLVSLLLAGMMRETFSDETIPSRAQLRSILSLNQVRFESTAEGGLQPVCFCSIPVAADTIPKTVAQALIATEDRRYYFHPGIDPIGITRAIRRNLRSGRLAEGGSTITQQLVKKTLLSSEQTFRRKRSEAILALAVENHFSKSEILTFYFNRMEFGRAAGRPIVGVEQASLVFFGKHVNQLSLYESALLIGVLKAPSQLNPLTNPQAARARAGVVLSAMVRKGYITQKQADAAMAKGMRRGNEKPVWVETRYFTHWIEREMKRVRPDMQPAPGLRLFVTLDSKAQQYAERAITRAVAGRNNEAALVSMTFDGAVRALVGGRSYARSQFDRATQALRQPASAFKPIIYLAALERGLSPNTKVLDAPLAPARRRGYGGTRRYYGPIPLQDALAYSANTATIRVCHAVGAAHVGEVARRLGIRSKLANNCGMALGISEVTLVELTAAYGAFADGGFLVTPYGIAGIADGRGQILYWREGEVWQRVVAAKHARQMQAMLRHVVAHGTATPANIGTFAAGKTGTNDQFRDAWFVGYSDSLVTGLWQGNDDFSPMENVTGHMLAGAWANFNANVRASTSTDGNFSALYRALCSLPYGWPTCSQRGG
jgi:penicillin-binding protein 1A